MQFQDPILRELYETIEHIDDATTDELVRLRDRLQGSGRDAAPRDLEEYHESRLARERDRQSLASRVAVLFGQTPERRFSRQLRDAELLHAEYQDSVRQFSSIVEQGNDELQGIRLELLRAQGFFETSIELYSRAHSAQQDAEKELEKLRAREPQKLNLSIYEKQEQVSLARKEALQLRHETDRAKTTFRSLLYREQSLSALHDRNEKRLYVCELQLHAFGTKIQEWRTEQFVSMRHGSTSLREHYELAGIFDQKLDRFLHEHVGSSPDEVLDTNYGIGGKGPEHPLITRWEQVKLS